MAIDDIPFLEPVKTGVFWILIGAGIMVGATGWWVGRDAGSAEPVVALLGAYFVTYIPAAFACVSWSIRRRKVIVKPEDNDVALDTEKRKISDIKKLNMKDIKRNARILFVDDQEQSAVELLKNLGFQVDKVADVDLSMEKNIIKKLKYDLVFLDIQGVGNAYEEKSGLGILNALKSNGKWPYVVSYTSKSYPLGSPENKALENLSDGIADKQRPESYETIAATWIERAFSIDGIIEEVLSHIVPSKERDKLALNLGSLSISEMESYIKNNLKDVPKQRIDAIIKRLRVVNAFRG